MSDSKTSDPSRNSTPHKGEPPAAAANSSSRPAQAPVSAATQYWLNVIAAGKAAKAADAAPVEAAEPGRQRGMRA
jgi:hypothetical protein